MAVLLCDAKKHSRPRGSGFESVCSKILVNKRRGRIQIVQCYFIDDMKEINSTLIDQDWLEICQLIFLRASRNVPHFDVNWYIYPYMCNSVFCDIHPFGLPATAEHGGGPGECAAVLWGGAGHGRPSGGALRDQEPLQAADPGDLPDPPAAGGLRPWAARRLLTSSAPGLVLQQGMRRCGG